MKIYATLKYDYFNLQRGTNENWQSFVDALLDKCTEYGFDGVVTEPHSNATTDEWQTELQGYIDKQLYLLDGCQSRSLDVVLMAGNPLNKKWGLVGPGRPCDVLYTHPSVVAIKHGDEPDEAEWANTKAGYDAIVKYYDLPVIDIFIGEQIGGCTGQDVSGYTKDRLPQYINWWNERTQYKCAVRNYPFRSRDKMVNGVHEKGDYDLYKPYIPQKLGTTPLEFAKLMRDKAPRDWWFVSQTFGKGKNKGEESYWRFPTKRELLSQLSIARNHGAEAVICWSLTPNQDNHFALLDSDNNPETAWDGSLPVEAIKEYEN